MEHYLRQFVLIIDQLLLNLALKSVRIEIRKNSSTV